MPTNYPIGVLQKSEIPAALFEIPEPPKTLYIRGSLPPPHYILLAVVGSRKCTPYGKEVCKKLISGLKGFPVAIVSGLALGIDSIAHEAALSAGLPTIAFPGSGLNNDVLYPRSNQSLANRILENKGCLISEFEPHVKADVWTFPKRNRIMAGISKATLVVEADIKSGTLITARLATEYNRDVFTVPQSIFSSTSEGPLMLLRLGATPIGKSEDILDALGFDVETIDRTCQQKLFEDMNMEEKEIIDALSTPLSRDELFEVLNFDIEKLNGNLRVLEIKGLIKEELGKIRLA